MSNFDSGNKTVELNINNLKGSVRYELYVISDWDNLSKVKETNINVQDILQIKELIKGPSVLLIKLSGIK